MKAAVFILISWAACAGQAVAMLGEDVLDVRARYGPVVRSTYEDQVVREYFNFKKFSVMVEYRESRSAAEVLTCTNAVHLDEEEVLALGAAVAGTNAWKPDSILGGVFNKAWMSGTNFVIFWKKGIMEGDQVVVARQALAEVAARDRQAKAEKTAEGFGPARSTPAKD